MILRAKFVPQDPARLYAVVPGAPVEPKKEFVGAMFDVIEHFTDRRKVLFDGPVAAFGPIETDAGLRSLMVISRRPIRPRGTIVPRLRSVVVAADHVVQAQRHRVV